MRAFFRLLRWLIAAPLRLIGHRYVRIGGLLAITGLFLAYSPQDPTFYGVAGSFLAVSFLARPLGRWLTPKPQRKMAVLPAMPSRPMPEQVAPSPPPAPPPPRLPEGPRRPAPSPVMAAVSARALYSPNEAEIRQQLPAQLQKLLTPD